MIANGITASRYVKVQKDKRSGELRKKLTPGEDRTRNLLMISVEVRRLSH